MSSSSLAINVPGPPPRSIDTAATSTGKTATTNPEEYNASSAMPHPSDLLVVPGSDGTPRTIPSPSPVMTVPTMASGSEPTIPASNSSAQLPRSSLPQISVLDFLEIDPRPTFVVSLTSPDLPIVYSNPTLNNSPALRNIFSEPRSSHTGLWDGITEANPNDIGAQPRPLQTVVYVGFSWTRAVLGGGQYAVISANLPVPAEAGATVADAHAATAGPGSEFPQEGKVRPAATGVPASATQRLHEVANALALSTQPPARPSILSRTAPTTTPTITPTATETKTPLLPPPAPPTPPTSAVFSPPENNPSQGQPPQQATTLREETIKQVSFDADFLEQGFFVSGTAVHDSKIAAAAATAAADRPANSGYKDQFKSITDFMPVGMSVFDAAGNVTFANHAFYSIMGCTPPATAPNGMAMVRADFMSCIDDEDQDAVQRFFAQAAHVTNKTFGFRVKKQQDPEAAAASMESILETAVPASLPLTPSSCVSSENEHDADATPRKRLSMISTPSTKATIPALTPASSAGGGLPEMPEMPMRRNSLAPSSVHQDKEPQGSRVLATTHSEKDAQGKLVRILLCLRDITEHQNIAEAADRHAQQANNLRRMAELATIGMYEMDMDGRLRGANRVFYEMCGLEKSADDDSEIFYPWLQCVAAEDQPLVQRCLDRLANAAGQGNGFGGGWEIPEDSVLADNDDLYNPDSHHQIDHQTVEVRFKTPWTADDGAGGHIVAPRWIEASFLPVRDSDGNVQSVTGCLSDISLRRWQLERERQVKEEAIESKRQQENFVDITSHEIRNPLTVIMHCGDAVLECLTKLRDDVRAVGVSVPGNTRQRALAMLEDGIDYAEIIVGSALHQKAIVDDILTMSKLDSDLLAVTPVTVDPIEIVRSTLKMFDVQARQQHIQLRMAIDTSYYKELPATTFFTTTVSGTPTAIPFLVLDPSRVKQILINLLTNALKFTQSVDVREVMTTVSVSRTRPTDAMCSVSFVPPPADNKLASAYLYGGSAGAAASLPSSASSSSPPSPTSPTSPTGDAPRSPMGDPVFLIFEVKDTGEGLTKEAMESLFQKFVQADSNTHIKHGGSGLGLFISKRLAEIQNGAIGVASAPGVGSTFVFYIEAYVPPPSAVPEILSPGEAAKIALAAGLSNASNGLASSNSAGSIGSGRKHGSSTSLASEARPRSSRSSRDLQRLGRKSSDGDRVSNGFEIGSDSGRGTPSLPKSPVTVYSSGSRQKLADTATASSTNDAQASEAVAGVAGAGAGGQLASVPVTPPEIRGVLLVEDNIVNQKVTRRYFEKYGFNVQVAANGIEAMDVIQASDRRVPGSYPISVVLMDMEMPVQDGLTCTRHIRALEEAGAFAGGRMPVLMITGNARPEQIADARAAGCDDVVVKPFQMTLLFEHIQLVMRTLWEDDVRTLAQNASDPEANANASVNVNVNVKVNDISKSANQKMEAGPDTTPSSPKQSKMDDDDDKVDEGVVLRRQNSDQP
ncbi:hypothetical protein SCUCBS95973_008028 [Sporothrix curviconia]|uniref:Uncharacterized protein n=1 Tax=Sporothrix curviconia TaxID=1260050 RepID=A0ABP0CIN9_9PEZI